MLDAVEAQLNDDEIRPLTDRPRIRSADIVTYQVDASLILYPGPDAALVLQEAIDAVNAYIAQETHIGLAPTLAGFYSALKQPGVYDVVLNQPAAAIVLTDYQSAHCTSVTVVIGAFMTDSLLPINATQLERDLESSLERASDLPVPIKDVWNADQCPEHLLPWLAWSFLSMFGTVIGR